MNHSYQYDLLFKINSFLIVLFLTLSVLLFSGVSILSKLILLSILFVIILLCLFSNCLILNVILKKIEFYIFILLNFYLTINTYLISKVKFESKIEFINYSLYFFVFLTFYFLASSKKEQLVKEIIFGFLFVQFFLIFLYIFYKDFGIYFFVYNPNILSGWCLISWLFNFEIIKKNKSLKTISLANLLISTFLVFLLKSYSAVLIIIFVLLLNFLEKSFLIAIIGFLLICIGIIFNFKSFLDRVIWNIIGLRVFLDNLLFGVGLNNFKFVYQKYSFNLPLSSTATIFIHNYFLHMLVELGIFWFLLFFIFIYLVFKNGLKNKNLEFTLPLAGILIQNLFDYNLIISQNSILFFIFCACIFANECKIEKKESKVSSLLFILFFLFWFLYVLKIQRNLMFLDSNNPIKLQEVVRLDKSCWYGYKKLALNYFMQKDYKNSELNFINAIKNNPFDSESYFYLAVIYKNSGDLNKAYSYLKKAVEIYPKISEKYIKLFQTIKQ